MAQAGRETEIKVPVIDLDPVREALQRTGATLLHPMTREENIVLDSENSQLENRGSLLRLRRYGSKCTVTYKGPASFKGTIKDRIEYESEVADFDQVVAVFSSLGFSQVAGYEKDREEWIRDDVTIVLDHTPMGNFIEIEGLPEKLKSTAEALAIDPKNGVRGSYLDLWADFRALHPERKLPTDMVFDR